jgi:hypothetical protein
VDGLGFFRRSARPDPAQVTALIDEHLHLGVEPVLRELRIPSPTYYRWCHTQKEPCPRRRQDIELTGRIQQVHIDSGRIYGSPRVHAVLKREGVHVGRKRDERLMRQAGLTGISPRRAKLHPPRSGRRPCPRPGRARLHRPRTEPTIHGSSVLVNEPGPRKGRCDFPRGRPPAVTRRRRRACRAGAADRRAARGAGRSTGPASLPSSNVVACRVARRAGS